MYGALLNTCFVTTMSSSNVKAQPTDCSFTWSIIHLHRQVLKPFHILPTMTVEQQGDIEVAAALERQRQQQQADEARRQADAEAGSDDEEGLAKARAWDDFKDTHPYGSGNSKLRLCG